MTMTGNEAYQAILAHHQSLSDGVARHAEAVRQSAQTGAAWEPAAATLIAYLADEVLPHAAAEEQSIYQVARAHPELEQPVRTMIDEHRLLAETAEQLATTGSGDGAATLAATISSLFTTHVQKENDVILPLVSADPDVELAVVVEEMHRLTKAAQRDGGTGGPTEPDLVTGLTSLLLDAASDLAYAGQGDRACRFTAGAWALLRSPRPRLAVRVTAKLHGLARSVTAEPVAFTSGPRPAGASAGVGDAELDVRTLAPAKRHEKIFATYGALAPGAGFVLVNDHDPKPLRYQLEAEHAGQFIWEALEEGPTVWRVRIGRPAAARTAGAESELDVRRFPHGQRHDVIFTTYQALVPGGGFVLVNDHDPVPLRYQFEAQFPGKYTWEYQEAGPELWRVRIGRPAAAAAGR